MFKSNKKRIGILTFHFPYNYGAMLQAYALQKTISKNKNIYCEIIAYEPEEHTNIFKVSIKNYITFKEVSGFFNKIKVILSGCYAYFKERNIERDYNYRKFQRLLKKSKKFKSKTNLVKHLNYDVIVVGSDQIWRKFENYDDVYFLNFNSSNIKKVSYSASAGGCFPNEDLTLIKDYLCKFDFISVREKVLSNQLLECGIPNRVDFDPTLLLQKDDYIKIEKKVKRKKDFIFVYLCRDERLVKVLNYVSQKFNYEIVVGPYVDFKEKVNFCFSKLDYIGPQEFLYCVHHAAFVVTSSFHCTVFSIVFDTPFTILDGIGAFERIKNLLDLTELRSHIFESLEKIDFDSDYRKAKNIINNSTKSSIQYIEHDICGNK